MPGSGARGREARADRTARRGRAASCRGAKRPACRDASRKCWSKGASRTDAALLRGRTRRNTTVNFVGAAEAGRARAGEDHGRVVDDVARFPGGARRRLTGRRCVAIFGPTASGKSAVAEAIAELIPAELVSADSMQVYRGLPILTNQPARPAASRRRSGISTTRRPSPSTRRSRTPPIDESLAARQDTGRRRRHRPLLPRRSRRPRRPAGAAPGRARALGRRLRPARSRRPRTRLLAERDPAAAAAVHPNDRRRVVRALELAEAGSSLRPRHDRLWTRRRGMPTLIVGLDVPRDELARRIAERTRAMFAARSRRRGARGARRPTLVDGAEGDRPPRSRRAPRARGDRGRSPCDAAVRRVPAQVDAPDPRPC